MTQWLCEGFMPDDHILLFIGKPHNGKSWFVESLGVAAAGGKPFLDTYRTKYKNVIIIDEDTPTNILEERLRRLAAGMGLLLDDIPIDRRSMQGFRLDDTSSMNSLKQDISQSSSPVLLIIDSLSSVQGRWDQNRTNGAIKIGEALNELKVAGATILVAHHISLKTKNEKSYGNSEDFTSQAMGNTQIVAKSDTAYGIWELPSKEHTRFVISTKPRRQSLQVTEPVCVELTEDRDKNWARLVFLDEIPRVQSDDALFIAPIFVQDQREVDFKAVCSTIGEILPHRRLTAALSELENEKVILRGTQKHNRYTYRINPDFHNDFSLSTSYWDELR